MRKKYDIHRPADKCVMCGQNLVELDRHPSALEGDEEDQVLLRYDYCPDCWYKVKETPFFSHWIARRFPKTAESTRSQRQSTKKHVLTLFKQTAESDGPNRSARLYILAHLLLRLRAFNWCGYDTDPESGTRVLVFEHARSREKIFIPSINLNEDQLREAQKFIDDILNQHQQQ